MFVWSKAKALSNPQSGKWVRRARPESEWLRVEMPEQQIVSDKLWARVQERLAYVNKVYGARGREGGLMNLSAASSPCIFSGLLKCGKCGSNFALVSGKGKYYRSATYGCPMAVFRGTCANALRVERIS